MNCLFGALSRRASEERFDPFSCRIRALWERKFASKRSPFGGFVLLFQNFRVKRLDEERSRPHIPEQRHEVGLTSKGQHGSVLATFLQDLGNVGKICCNHGSKFLLNKGDIYGYNKKKNNNWNQNLAWGLPLIRPSKKNPQMQNVPSANTKRTA